MDTLRLLSDILHVDMLFDINTTKLEPADVDKQLLSLLYIHVQ